MDKKICVYAICKNEEKNIEAWYNSMKEADEIVVCDTGSTDKSVELLKSLGIHVYEINVSPWRFDTARNMSLSFVPEDCEICVCTDLDEVFNEGWASKVKEAFDESTTRLKYDYNWGFDENGNPGVFFHLDKIHRNKMYKWTHPVHEVLTPLAHEDIKYVSGVTLNHHQDVTKSRKEYLSLLELSVEENPQDDRNMHYLGREYMYYQNWDKCIETLKKHLELKSAIWKDERSASMRFIARSYYAKGDTANMIKWYKEAINEAPYLREAYIELAKYYYDNKEYKIACIYLDEALKIKERAATYINEDYAWDYTFYDMVSNCKFYSGSLFESYFYACVAYDLNNKDTRLKTNIDIIKQAILKNN